MSGAGNDDHDPAHVEAAAWLRKQFPQPHVAVAAGDDLVRDLSYYDRTFGLGESASDREGDQLTGATKRITKAAASTYLAAALATPRSGIDSLPGIRTTTDQTQS